jgi:hypothetical protein
VTSADAAALFGAYATILSVLVGFATLLLQALSSEANGFERQHGQDNGARLAFLLRAFLTAAIMLGGFLLVAAQSDDVARTAGAFGDAWLIRPVAVLRAVFVLLTAGYLVAICFALRFKGTP